MENVDLMIIPVGISLLAYFFYKNSTLEAIRMFGVVFSLYPRHYAMPPRWLRKFFDLPKKEIGKYFIIRLYFAIFHILLGIIGFVVCFCDLGAVVVSIQAMFQIVWIIVDTVVFLIHWHIFKKSQH